jgi:hypothetical protein
MFNKTQRLNEVELRNIAILEEGRKIYESGNKPPYNQKDKEAFASAYLERIIQREGL